MIGYRCKCGKCTGWSSMGMSDCQGCEECNTTLASHPEGHKELAPHEYEIMYYQHTGKPYKICKNCMKTDEESYKLAKIKD